MVCSTERERERERERGGGRLEWILPLLHYGEVTLYIWTKDGSLVLVQWRNESCPSLFQQSPPLRALALWSRLHCLPGHIYHSAASGPRRQWHFHQVSVLSITYSLQQVATSSADKRLIMNPKTYTVRTAMSCKWPWSVSPGDDANQAC